MYRIPIGLAFSSLLLVGCGSDDRTNTKPNDPTPLDYSQLQATPVSEAGLVRADRNTLERHLKNGLRLQLQGGGHFSGGGGTAVDANAPPAAGAPERAGSDDLANGGAGFSETNVHVQGVDEADYAKYDGRHWFVAFYPDHHWQRRPGPAQTPGLQIVATDPATPDAEIVGKFSFDNDWGGVSEMYLVQQDEQTTHVAALRNQWGNVMPFLPGIAMDFAHPAIGMSDALIWPGPINSKVRVQLVKVKDPSSPTQDWDIQIDGSLIDSRKIGNTLYLITRYDSWLETINYDYGDSRTRAHNEASLERTSLNDLIPHYEADGQRRPLSPDCFIQQDIKDNYGFATLVNITAIDLQSQRLLSSQCINSSVEVMSMSTESLYLTGTVYDPASRGQTTIVHKFRLDRSGPAYAASGKVKGGLSWNSDPAFRMHEHENQFRIVTTDWHRGGITPGPRPEPGIIIGPDMPTAGPEHRLTILEQQGNSLVQLSQLPNSRRPEPIGKPGEDIFSVRFNGDRAYIVTFLRTDPLYAIDLSDPLDPFIAGELEVPGFATYMHPVGEHYLFTLGQDADERGVAQGLKAELINISGDEPRVHTTLKFGDMGSYSEALQNLRVLTFLPGDEDTLRIAVPMTIYKSASERGHWQWQYTGLQLLEVQGITGQRGRLTDAGIVMGARGDGNAQAFPRSGLERSVLHDDAVFYTYNNGIWVAKWDDPQNAIGPIGQDQDPIACTTEFVYGLHVTVNLRGNTVGQNPCRTDVTATDGDYSEKLMPLFDGEEAGVCRFVGAGERAGTYVLNAYMPGFSQHTSRVRVDADECHVIPERVAVTLVQERITPPDDREVPPPPPPPGDDEPPFACTLEARASLVVHLNSPGADASDFCDAQVLAVQRDNRYKLDVFREATREDPRGYRCYFVGPYEVAGDMSVQVTQSGYQPLEVDGIVVPADECHVTTQVLELTMTPE